MINYHISITSAHYIVFYDMLAEKFTEEYKKLNRKKIPKTSDREYWELSVHYIDKDPDVIAYNLFAVKGADSEYYFWRKFNEARGNKPDVPVRAGALTKALKYLGFITPENFPAEESEFAVGDNLWLQFCLEFKEQLRAATHKSIPLNNVISGMSKNDSIAVFTESSPAPRTPKYLGIVPSLSDEFIGRVEELKHLYHTLSETNKIVFLHGLPGIGKTSLVKFFIDQYRNEFDHFIWIDIGRAKDELFNRTTERLHFQLEEAFMPLYIFLNNGVINGTLNLQQQFDYSIGLLNNIEGRNLLIIDNYDDSILSYRNRLPRTPQWKILATGRYKVIGTKNVPLNSLREVDAINLFKSLCEKSVDENILNSFLFEIDYHTLMIEISAKTLQESSSISLDFLYKKLRKGELNDPELSEVIATEYGHESGKLIKHLLLLFDLKLISEEEKMVLKTWYYLQPATYSIENISHFVGNVLDQDILTAVLISLSSKGWLTYDVVKNTYSMHRLIQKAILYMLSPKILDASSLIEFYSRILQSQNLEINKMLQTQYSSDYLLELINDDDMVDPYVGELFYSKAQAAKKTSQFTYAIVYLEKSINVYNELMRLNESVFGPFKKVNDDCLKFHFIVNRRSGFVKRRIA